MCSSQSWSCSGFLMLLHMLSLLVVDNPRGGGIVGGYFSRGKFSCFKFTTQIPGLQRNFPWRSHPEEFSCETCYKAKPWSGWDDEQRGAAAELHQAVGLRECKLHHALSCPLESNLCDWGVEFHCQSLTTRQCLNKLDPHHPRSAADGAPLHSEWHLMQLSSFLAIGKRNHEFWV